MPHDRHVTDAATACEVPALVERFLRDRTARRGATAEIPPPGRGSLPPAIQPA